ncbi:MAG: hypothetical protein LWW86_08700 [Micrococcales bacterium]|nr:hypothetical protein [Micrococcales bacterium]
MIQSKRLAVGVVGDWRDPECDPVSAEALDPSSIVDGQGRLSVLAPPRPGASSVRYAVDDGHGATAQGQVQLSVLDLRTGKPANPKTQPDVVRGAVGKPVQIEPLANDVPGADPAEADATMRLAAAIRAPGGGLQVDTNSSTGVVTVTGTQPGTYELSYGAVVGGAPGAGRIRVDIVGAPDPDARRSPCPTRPRCATRRR